MGEKERYVCIGYINNAQDLCQRFVKVNEENVFLEDEEHRYEKTLLFGVKNNSERNAYHLGGVYEIEEVSEDSFTRVFLNKVIELSKEISMESKSQLESFKYEKNNKKISKQNENEFMNMKLKDILSSSSYKKRILMKWLIGKL